MKVKMRSVIPGRISMRINELLHNENVSCFFKESLQFSYGVTSITSNSVTGNVLIYYNTELIDYTTVIKRITAVDSDDIPLPIYKAYHEEIDEIKVLSNQFIPKFFAHKYPIKTYYHEAALSRRLAILSVIVSVFCIFTSASLTLVLSLMVLGFPGILYAIRQSAYRSVQKNLRYKKFDFKNPNLIYEIAEIEHLYIEDTLLSNPVSIDRIKGFSNASYDQAEELVGELRKLGIIDIGMIMKKNNDDNHYISNILGIKMIKLNRSHEDQTGAIIKSPSLNTLGKEQVVVFQGYEQKKPNAENCVIVFKLNVINDIPSVIAVSKYCNQLLIRGVNMTVTTHVIGIFFAAAKIITPLSSIGIYFLNYIGNIMYINTQLLLCEKEHLYEIQCRTSGRV